MDITAIISQYLHDNRRLVVPSFGTFLVKDTGEVLFSELLKTDDGVLRSLLVAKGLSELAAAGAIDRFIFEAHDALSENGRFQVGSIGTLVAGSNGTLRLEHPDVPHPTAKVKIASKPDIRHDCQPADTVDRKRNKRGGADWFMIIAIFVLLCALAAIGYGWYCSTLESEQDDAMMDELRYHVEQSATTDNQIHKTI